MADTLSRILGPVNIANGASTLFTGTAAHTYTIKYICIVNDSGGDIDVKLGINGVTDADLILPLVTIQDGGKAEYGGMLVLDGTETLDADASATGLTITVAGLDQT